MKTRASLSARERKLMLEMLAGLTPAERLQLASPDFITEDEADIIVCNRRSDEPTIPADQVFAEIGYTPRRQRA
jgi:hypothetical protein